MKEFYTGADVRNLLDQLGARPVAYHASFAKLAGSVTAGVMLSQAFYWSLMPGTQKNKGWFYKTGLEWWNETGLSRSEQQTARKRLVTSGLLDETERGMPKKLFYRVDCDVLASALCGATREMSVEQIANLYSAHLSRLSALAKARAWKMAEHLAKQGAKPPRIDQVNYVEVLLRENARCHICGQAIVLGPGRSAKSLSFDHALPINKGGDHTSENVRCAHLGCNSSKGDDESFPQSDLLFDSTQECGATAGMDAVGAPTSVQGYSTIKARDSHLNHSETQALQAGRTAETVFSLPLTDGTEFLVLEEDLKLWSMTYPAVNVLQQLREMHVYFVNRPRKKRTARGIRQFICTWLSKHQDRGTRGEIATEPAATGPCTKHPGSGLTPTGRCWGCQSERAAAHEAARQSQTTEVHA